MFILITDCFENRPRLLRISIIENAYTQNSYSKDKDTEVVTRLNNTFTRIDLHDGTFVTCQETPQELYKLTKKEMQ